MTSNRHHLILCQHIIQCSHHAKTGLVIHPFWDMREYYSYTDLDGTTTTVDNINHRVMRMGPGRSLPCVVGTDTLPPSLAELKVIF
jgi:hypothetical protein